jgi:hypothetical protein
MTDIQIYKHRITEDRACPLYETCLLEAALEDAVMVPCIYCRRSKMKGGDQIMKTPNHPAGANPAQE